MVSPSPFVVSLSNHQPQLYEPHASDSEGTTRTMAFYVYILKCADDSYYTGHTDKLEARIQSHQSGEIPGYTLKRRPVNLVFSEEFPARIDAIERERQIKRWTRRKKEALIQRIGNACGNSPDHQTFGRAQRLSRTHQRDGRKPAALRQAQGERKWALRQAQGERTTGSAVMTSHTNEEAFESTVESMLGEGGWRSGDRTEWDVARALFPAQAVAFMQATQPEQWAAMAGLHGDNLEPLIVEALVRELDLKGTLDVLRHGFKFYGKTSAWPTSSPRTA